MDGGLGDWPEKVIKNDAGTNRLVFFSPLKERGREGETLTHTHNRYQQGHGFAGSGGRNSTSAMDAWERHAPPPVLASDWVPTQSVGWAQFYKELIVPFVVNLFFFSFALHLVNVLVLLFLRSISPSSSLPFILFSLSSTRAQLNPRPLPPLPSHYYLTIFI